MYRIKCILVTVKWLAQVTKYYKTLQYIMLYFVNVRIRTQCGNHHNIMILNAFTYSLNYSC